MLIGEPEGKVDLRPRCKKTGEVVKPTEWRCTLFKPGRETWMRVNPATFDIEIEELWLNETALTQASQERELHEAVGSTEFKPLAVIPQSVVAQSLKDGWYHDEEKWKRWMNDGDNSYLRVTRGRV